MKRLISKIITSIKGEPYQIDDSIASGAFAGMVLERCCMLVRGWLYRPLFKKSGKAIFIGRHVKIKSKRNIRCDSITIHDHCHINAMNRR